MTTACRNVTLCALALCVVGCSSGSDSETLALDQTLDAAGFLIAADIVADSSASGSYLVSCAYKSGVKQLKYSKADVEQNKICPLEAAPTGQPGPVAVPAREGGGDTSAGQYSIKLDGTNYTYIKLSQNMNISSNKSAYKEGTDYCIIASSVNATSACTLSAASEIKVMGLNLSGCQLKAGYLWSGHVTVSPAPSACE